LFRFALDQLKAGNRGNAAKFITIVVDITAKLKRRKSCYVDNKLLKSVADSGDIQNVMAAVDEIKNCSELNMKNASNQLSRP